MNLLAPTLLLACLVVMDDGKPVPKAPADPEELPDYETLLNEKMRRDITPDRNANALLWRALGPAPDGGKGMPAAYFKWLGIDEPPKDGRHFIGIDTFVTDYLKLEHGGLQAFYDQLDPARERPWKA